MTHAHDRTLLASLGFADPDKKDPLHDLACQYLAADGIREKVAAHVWGSDPPRRPEEWANRPDDTWHIISEQEVHVVKRGGFTVGFLDVLIARYSASKSEYGEYCVGSNMLVVEVKSNRVSVSDVLRQLSLYEGSFVWNKSCEKHKIHWPTETGSAGWWHAAKPTWVLATCYPISKRDADALSSAEIRHVQLSRTKIEAWAAEQDKATYQAPEV